ncbi:TPA: hypothetical protein N0F65_005327 [Lagenidium giganteum]|uniref:Probable pectate lyase F n=1 Tax=Lagenidium giganteum TaxID=4803 RepID=A0AAV2YTE5_9STRA|nr:TPA: hypothetical protein N0F65_005327 [Lagenidium giganteum]
MTQFSDEDPYDVVAAAVERSNVHDTASAPAGFLWGTASDSALASFRAKEIILLAEIEADELCSCHLSQRVLVERDLYRQNHRYASTTLTELESKQLSLNRKIQVNQEKLLHVRARIAELTANPLVLGTKPALDPVTAAAVRIQTAFRRDKARRAFQQLVRRVVQKVYDPASQQYFFYNHHTGVSQWQIPAAIHAAIADEPQHHSQKGGDIVEAATMIQGLFRRRAARRALHALLAQVYQKVEDPETGLYYYYSKRTGVSQWNKPKLLGASELPSPLRTPALEPHSAPGSDEDQQTRAVRTIQRLYRTRASRAFLRDLLGGTIEKVYDADFDAWYYFNHRTQQSFWESLSMQPWRMLLRPGVASATRSS